MKKGFLFITFLVSIITVTAQPGEPAAIRISGTKFTYSIIQKWINEYTKLYPGISFILDSRIPVDSADISIASHILNPGDVKEGQEAIALTRYAQLPIVNSRRADVVQLQAKGFTGADFRKIYFAENTSSVITDQFAVYKREKPACASVAFANHFGNQHKDITGIGVKGDDRDLLNAVKRDINGISYNNLGFIYDITTRKITDSIAIIPIDINENGKIDVAENIYNSLDEVVAFLEKTKNLNIPTENVNVLFKKESGKTVKQFLQWVITSGQQYNHAFGFLDLNAATIQAQEQLLTYSTGLHKCIASSRQLMAGKTAGIK